MPVIKCNRHSCESVLCDRYSPKYGYICHSCFDELVERGTEQSVEDFMAEEFIVSNYRDAFSRFDAVFPTSVNVRFFGAVPENEIREVENDR